MKKILLIVLVSALARTANAQWVTIPDTNFVAFLKSQGLSACFNGNQMDTTCPGIANAHQLNAYTYKGITSLEGLQYFDHLENLVFREDSIDYLPDLPGSLQYLVLFSTHLITLNLPQQLQFLSCSVNPHLHFPAALPNTLKQLHWNNNLLLPNVPPLPDSLEQLSLTGLGVTSFSSPFPPHLTQLFLYLNAITQLPSLPSSLQVLDCHSNGLTSLPPLPNLINLTCSSNFLDSLPPLPNSIKELDVSSNHLNTLPALPVALQRLDAGFNPIVQLPELPKSLISLNCNGCYLQYLPELPDSLELLNIQNNFFLHCLPELKIIRNFYWDSSAVQCLPSYPKNVVQSVPSISNTPLCTAGNLNNCAYHYNISGILYNDSNNSCVVDYNDVRLRNLKLQVSQSGNIVQQGYFSDVYSFNTGLGTFQTSIDTTGLPFNITCPLSNNQTSVLTALDSIDTGINFGVECKTGVDLAVWSVNSVDAFRPASTVQINIKAGDWATFWGQHCNTHLLPGTLIVNINGPATYDATAIGALAPSSVSGSQQTISYTVSDWSAIDPAKAFNLLLKIDTAALTTQTVCITATISWNGADNNVANNQINTCIPVVSSLDPNDKTSSPAMGIPQDGWLNYTVRFQNTGNSYAQTIYLLDTLDTNLDAATFELLSWSHENQTTLNGNIVRFNFPGIHLPDSNSNEAGSHGYVQYRVKTKANLPIGTHIRNTAYIYFDFNPAVVTNTTDNFGCATDYHAFNETICSGDTLTFNGKQYFAEGTYNDTLQNQSGCDSIVSLYLAVNPLPQTNFYSDCQYAIEPSIICGWCGALFLNAHDADSVIWEIHPQCCWHDTVIYNVDTISIFSTYTSYCVPSDVYFEVPLGWLVFVCITAYNDCGVTTYCDTMALWPESISETHIENFALFPNPAKNQVTINAAQSAIGGDLQLRDITGHLLSTQPVTTPHFIINTSNLAAGIYMLTLQEKDGGIGVKRLVIE